MAKASILLAEDNEQLRDLMATSLRLDDYEVEGVSNGFDALDIMKTRKFDLLLSDIIMVGMDGIELALITSQDSPGTKVILISGYEEERARAVNLDSLIHGLLSKPFSLGELKQKISMALAE